MTHEWVTVGDRQWCLTCSAFQHRRDSRRPWVPFYRPTCPWDSAYAARKRLTERDTPPEDLFAGLVE